MFGRNTPEVTNDSFARWLRAQRPPFDWFHRQSELVQEGLAVLGDSYVFGIAEEASQAHQSAQQSEEAAVRKIAAEAATSLMRRREAPVSPPPPAGQGAKLFGREPDTSTPAGTP